jgi:hypothetical protein
VTVLAQDSGTTFTAAECAEPSGMVASRDADIWFARIHTETATTMVGGVSHAQFGAQFSPSHVQALTVSADFLVLNEIFHDDEYPPARLAEHPWLSSSRWRRLCAVGMLLIPALLAAVVARPL